MKTSLSLFIRRPRDIIHAQMRARQLCRLLGFAPLEQAKVVSSIFEIAHPIVHAEKFLELNFSVRNDRLQIVSDSGSTAGNKPRGSLQMSVQLPPSSAGMAVEDAIWAVSKLDDLPRSSLVDEIRQQNNDMLRALLELEKRQSPFAKNPGRARAA